MRLRRNSRDLNNHAQEILGEYRRRRLVPGNPSGADAARVVLCSAWCGGCAFVQVEGPVEVVGEGWVGANVEDYVEGVWGETR